MRVWQILCFWLAFTIRSRWVWVYVVNNVWCWNCLKTTMKSDSKRPPCCELRGLWIKRLWGPKCDFHPSHVFFPRSFAWKCAQKNIWIHHHSRPKGSKPCACQHLQLTMQFYVSVISVETLKRISSCWNRNNWLIRDTLSEVNSEVRKVNFPKMCKKNSN